jgi:hypothetical protein
MKFVLSKFKVSLLSVNHLFMTVNIWFGNYKTAYMWLSDYYASIHKESWYRECIKVGW